MGIIISAPNHLNMYLSNFKVLKTNLIISHINELNVHTLTYKIKYL